MEDYKQYLSESADETERRAAEQVMDGLSALRLEAKVQEVAAERAELLRRRLWQRISLAIIAVAIVAGAIFFVFEKKDAPATLPQAPEQQQQQQPLPSDVPTENPQPKKESEPIAQVNPTERLPNPRYPAPDMALVRGDDATNKALQARLNQIWYTDYPLLGLQLAPTYSQADQLFRQRDFNAAYVELERLERAQADAHRRNMEHINKQRMEADSSAAPILAKPMLSDTLLYLKAYCLLEMGEGAEALLYFNQMHAPKPAWKAQIQWYKGLGFLLAGEQANAKAQFRQIAAQGGHLYKRQAEKALGNIEY